MILTNEMLEKELNIVKEKAEKIEKYWEDCDNEVLDCDDASWEVSKIEETYVSNLSMYMISRELDKKVQRKEDEQYDVTKIRISEDDEKRYRDYDKKVLKIMNPEWKDEKISKELSMLYLFSGFAIGKDLKKDEYVLEEGFIRKKEKEI